MKADRKNTAILCGSNMNKCMDCGGKKGRTEVTGTFLCKSCQDKQFSELQRKYNPEKKRRIDVTKVDPIKQAKYLIEETEMSIPEIAKKTGVKYNTVWYHANQIRSNEEDKPDKWKDRYQKLKAEHEKLKLNYNSATKENEELKRETEELQVEIDALSNNLVKSEEMLMTDLVNEVADLQNVIGELNDEIKRLEKQNSKEKQKHDALLNYIMLVGGN